MEENAQYVAKNLSETNMTSAQFVNGGMSVMKI